MAIGFKQRYESLMNGQAEKFSKQELWMLIEKMNFLSINTLSIQKSGSNEEAEFWCKVDESTVLFYKAKKLELKKRYLKEKVCRF